MDALHDEVESLQAILMDDVLITKDAEGIPEMISTNILPVVGDENDQQYVCVTLEVLPTNGYPDVSPDFRLVKPRGLDDIRLNEIKAACNKKLAECVGCPVVFDLIEVVREHLTGSNMPSGQCVVCLYGFQDGDEFIKTECYHYLHSYCLARHLIAARRNYRDEQEKLPAWLQKKSKPFEASCPVCREKIADDESSLKTAMPPAELENAPDFCLTDDLKELQNKMKNLFLKQKSRGAIIDIGAESGTVISIQPQEEARREQQRNNMSNNSAISVTDIDQQIFGGALDRMGPTNHSTNSGSNQNPNSSTHNANASNPKYSPPSKHFKTTSLPVTNICRDPTNNNYTPNNRRHYRGGRRHQNHHYHHYHSGRRDPTMQTQATEGGAGGGTHEQSQQQQQKSAQHGNPGKSNKSQTTAGSSNAR